MEVNQKNILPLGKYLSFGLGCVSLALCLFVMVVSSSNRLNSGANETVPPQLFMWALLCAPVLSVIGMLTSILSRVEKKRFDLREYSSLAINLFAMAAFLLYMLVLPLIFAYLF
ncbi:MAG: hypothetical protein HC853_12135 [Anaerolineae bacterium]|nr:hypothetical protein [Anaerolineae bacterium]